MKLKPVGEQVVALMGASSGIGREAALRFAQRGAKVVVAARSEEGLRSLVDRLRSTGGEAEYVVADVTDFEQVKSVADRAVEAYGRLDTWVHLAATSVYANFWDITPEEFKRVVEVDLVGQAYGAMAALPHLMREGQGALVHVSSVLARRSAPLQAPYSASKHGIDGMLESLRVELLHEGWDGIGVTEVMPASINTPLFDKSRTKIGVKPQGFPPHYQPRVVAEAILYAAEHAPRELVAGGAGKQILAAQRLSPALMDAFMLRAGFSQQRTDQPKPESAPDGLYAPVPGHDTIQGDRGGFSHSLATWLDTHPAAKLGVAAGAVLGTAALLARR
jgi:NAD(P)-dependent dehydrogenase (short-subunit alcohol dehydrogenase family)